MAKRFIDIKIWEDNWFFGLSLEAKMLFFYMVTNCDHAGIIEINKVMAGVKTGITDLNSRFDDLISELQPKVERLNEDKWILMNFVKHQYKTLNAKNNCHKSACKILEDHGLAYDVENKSLVKFNPSLRLDQDLTYPKPTLELPLDKGRGTIKEEVKEERKGKRNKKVYTEEFESLWKSIHIHPGNKEPAFEAWKKLDEDDKQLCADSIPEYYVLEEIEADSQSGRTEKHVSSSINARFWENMEDKRRRVKKIEERKKIKADQESIKQPEDPLEIMHRELERDERKRREEQRKKDSNE